MVTTSMIKELREKTGIGMLECKKALEATNGDMAKAIDYLRERGSAIVEKKSSRIAAEGLVGILVNDNVGIVVEINSETDFVASNPEFKDLVSETMEVLINSDVKTVDEALSFNNNVISNRIAELTSKIGEKISLRRFERVTIHGNECIGTYLHNGGKIGTLIVLEGASSEVARDVAMHASAMRPQVVSRDEVTASEIEKEKEVLKEQAMNEGKSLEIASKMVEGRLNKFFKEICLNEQPFIKNDDETVEQFVKSNSGKVVKMIRYEVGEGIQKREENFAEEVMKTSQVK